MLSHPCEKPGRRLKSRGLGEELAAPQNDKRWDPLNGELGGNRRMVVSLDFDKNSLPHRLDRSLCKLRSHGLAGTAPGRPKIHNYRQWRLCGKGCEAGSVVDIHRRGDCGQCIFAGTTATLLIEARKGQAIGGAAFRTGDEDPPVIGSEVLIHGIAGLKFLVLAHEHTRMQY